MSKFKEGDQVTVFRMSGWSGWTPSMVDMIGGTYTIIEVSEPDPLIEDPEIYYRFVEGSYLYWFPENCIKLIKSEENEMKFKVGDRVKVIRKVTQENGWGNSWCPDMDYYIGKIYTIKTIDQYGVLLGDKWNYGFPFGSLELVEEKPIINSRELVEEKPKFDSLGFVESRGIKYQYLKPEDFNVQYLGDLCLTISTEIIKNPKGDAKVYWAVAFKNPKDQFNKQLARVAVNSKDRKALYVSKGYYRAEIIAKILSDLVYNDVNLSTEYKMFVRVLLNDYIGLTW